MEGKLLVARYKNRIIHISQYQKTEHHGKLLCPFCIPPIKVTHNVKGFFMAWRDQGGHNCRNISVDYFDAEWDGKEYVEIIDNKNGGMNVTVDINEIIVSKGNSYKSNTEKIEVPTDSNVEFPDYKRKEKVFRDIIRSVYQMKRLIEKNDYNSLKTLKFLFKVDKDECLSFDEIVYKCNEAGKAPNYRKRFFIFQVDKVIQSKGTTYINSYIIDGQQLVGILDFPYSINPLKKKYEGNYVIAYGKLKRSKNELGKSYLEIFNDFHVVKLNEDEVKHLFDDSKKEKFVYVAKPDNMENKKESVVSVLTPEITSSDNYLDCNISYRTNDLGKNSFEKQNFNSSQTQKSNSQSVDDEMKEKKIISINYQETFFKKIIKRIFRK